MNTQTVREIFLRGSTVDNSAASRARLVRISWRRSILLFLFSVPAMQAATGWADRLSLAAEIGAVRRELDGPLLQEQPNVFPGSTAAFRNGSSDTKAYGTMQVGVKLTEQFSLRAGYQDFGSTHVRLVPPPNIAYIQPPPQNFRFRDRAFTLDPVVTWQAGSRVTMHAFLGIAFNRTDVTLQDYHTPLLIFNPVWAKTSDSTQMRMGAGAEIQLNSQLRVRAGADYQRFSSFTKEGWLAHAGLAYAF